MEMQGLIELGSYARFLKEDIFMLWSEEFAVMECLRLDIVLPNLCPFPNFRVGCY